MKDILRRHFRLVCGLAIFGGSLLHARSVSAQAWEMVEPDVMLLIDNSGSMDWRDDTGRKAASISDDVEYSRWDWAEKACRAGGYSRADKTSWQKVQDTFLGTIPGPNYKCMVEMPAQRPALFALRDESMSDYLPDHISEYRGVGYPHFRAVNCPAGMWQDYGQCIDPFAKTESGTDIPIVSIRDYMTVTECYDNADNLYTASDGKDYCLNPNPEAIARQSNGILDTYGKHVRFGAMTYDNLPKCWGDKCATDRHEGRWDYGVYRSWKCGGIDNTTGTGIGDICYDWNAGARGGRAQWWDLETQTYKGAVGGLVGIGPNAESSAADVTKLLNSAEPLYCSPLASLVDDLGYYFANEPYVLPAASGGNDYYYRCRPKIAVLISDGQPTPDFEFPSGICTDDDVTLADWDPLGDERNSRNTHQEAGPPFATPDPKIFNCPWRSTPEEAAEVFDVGARILQQKMGIAPDSCEPPGCSPVFLVVIGFNVPDDVDCTDEKQKKKCYWYNPETYKPCWDGHPPCVQDPDAGVEDQGLCAMTPRAFLNETACQGWPWEPATVASNNYGAGGSVTHETSVMPPWLDSNAGLCSDVGTDVICRRSSNGSVERALFVENAGDMASVLDMILAEMSSNVATRTDAVVWNVPPTSAGFTNTTVAQYEFRSGYVAASGGPWKGVLTRKDWNCGDGEADKAEHIHNVAAQIADNQGTDRVILSYLETPTYSPTEPDFSSDLVKWLDPSPVSQGLKRLSDAAFDDCAFGVGDEAGDPSFCTGKYVVAQRIREETLSRGLADIYNSTPSILGPPYDRITSASYQLYRADGNLARSPYLFVGTNDGVLHGIDVDEISKPDDEAQPERWGFIPKSLIPELRRIYPLPGFRLTMDADGNVNGYELDDEGAGLYRHEYLLDGPSVARDILLVRRADVHSDPDVDIAAAWRAVVFGAGGQNTRLLYALDVTDAIKDDTAATLPKVRWEINPDGVDGVGMFANNADASDGHIALTKMGAPISKPAVAYVREDVGGATKVKTIMAAAIVPGGYKKNPNPNAADAEDGNSGVYILRIGDGKVIRYLDPAVEDDICRGEVGLIHDTNDDSLWDGAQFIGEPVVPHGTRNLNVTDHAFIGDDRGRLWIIDMNDDDPDKWCLGMYFDTLLAWDYPYEDCVDTASALCTPSDCVWTDCCKGGEGDLPCDATSDTYVAYKARNMLAPRVSILGAPAIAQDKDSRDVIVFGTGQYDELTAWNRNRIFSLTDTTEAVADSGGAFLRFKHTPVINWWVGDPVPSGDPFATIPDGTVKTRLTAIRTEMTRTPNPTYINPTDYPLYNSGETGGGGDTDAAAASVTVPQAFWNVGEKLIGRPVVFDEVAYFTTFVPLNDKDNLDDACDQGASRVWALDYNSYDASILSDNEAYVGKFVDDNGKYIPFMNYYHELFSGVQVVKRPQCDPNDPIVFKLLVQKANPGAEVSKAGAPAADAVKTQTIDIPRGKGSTSLVAVRFDSWSIVF